LSPFTCAATCADVCRRGADPSCEEALAQVAKIQAFITENYYDCTNEILAGLGQAYGSGGDFMRNINAAAGLGAAESAAAAVGAYCERAWFLRDVGPSTR
jgi:hypothetical protein